MDQMIYLKDVVTLELHEERCVGCGMCLTVCPHAVLGMDNRYASIKNRDACMECGACARNCPTEAVRVRSGVGCAAAVINAALGRDKASCCCVVESKETPGDPTACSGGSKESTCC